MKWKSLLATKDGNVIKFKGYDQKECESIQLMIALTTKWEFCTDEKLPCEFKQKMSRNLEKEDYPSFKQIFNIPHLVSAGRDAKEHYVITEFEQNDCTGKTLKKLTVHAASEYDCFSCFG